ncbi:hypothetical protein ACPA54_00615 [Uniformispora flossi]|uniref:hypothetical protein n=1 Tax=Uniformispora flossi TaxID=3390723 RepID=UPI003C2BC1F1
MSYDLAVWKGDMPSGHREAGKAHCRLYGEYLDGETTTPVEAEIVDLLEVLARRWPDRDTGDDTPWASTPLAGGASGPYVYIALAWSSAEAVSRYVSEVADRLGLVCFDPQKGEVRAGMSISRGTATV